MAHVQQIDRTSPQFLVLRKTYGLLSLTLLTSAFFALISMNLNLGFGSYFLFMLLGLGILFATIAFRHTRFALLLVFTFAVVEGFALGPLLEGYKLSYGSQIIFLALFMTGALFILLSIVAIFSKTNFMRFAGFFFAGLIVIILGSILNIFLALPALSFIISIAGAIIFSALILIDTQRIIYSQGQLDYIMATIALYLDILNLFLMLLSILSIFNGGSRR